MSRWRGEGVDHFLRQAAAFTPHRITLGIYRRMGASLPTMAKNWGLKPMAWQPATALAKDEGTHLQLPEAV